MPMDVMKMMNQNGDEEICQSHPHVTQKLSLFGNKSHQPPARR